MAFFPRTIRAIISPLHGGEFTSFISDLENGWSNPIDKPQSFSDGRSQSKNKSFNFQPGSTQGWENYK